jgi:hypothetical protein
MEGQTKNDDDDDGYRFNLKPVTVADKENIDELIYAEDSYKSITHDSNFN